MYSKKNFVKGLYKTSKINKSESTPLSPHLNTSSDISSGIPKSFELSNEHKKEIYQYIYSTIKDILKDSSIFFNEQFIYNIDKYLSEKLPLLIKSALIDYENETKNKICQLDD